jgi:hypothetical protein
MWFAFNTRANSHAKGHKMKATPINNGETIRHILLFSITNRTSKTNIPSVH